MIDLVNDLILRLIDTGLLLGVLDCLGRLERIESVD
jgi:hypothetical protein